MGKAVDDFRLKTSAGKNLTTSEIRTLILQLIKGVVYLELVSFFLPDVWSSQSP